MRWIFLGLAVAVHCVASTTEARADFTLYASIYTGSVEKFNSSGSGSTLASGLNSPTGVAVSPLNGNVFVATNNAVQQYTPSGTSLGTFAPTYAQAGAMTFDSSGNLYAAVSNAGEVYKYGPSGGAIIAGFNVTGATGVAVDSSGDVFVSSSGGYIVEFAANGSFIRELTSTNLVGPGQMVLDGSGNLYVTNVGNGIIEKFSATTGADEGQFATDTFGGTYGLAYDPTSGKFFQANQGNGFITEFSSTGQNLGHFASGLNSPAYLALAPTAVPAPPSLLLASIPALLGLAFGRSRRRPAA